jgi:o-succinylbenzoate synthase
MCERLQRIGKACWTASLHVPMTSPIHYHRYTLRSGTALNSASVRKEFDGALIRVGNGYAAVHPWPEFGDASLNDQLAALAAGHVTPLLERALHCAAVDGAAREQGVSLFENLEVPASHYTWSFTKPTDWQLGYMERNGFMALKAKGFANYGETTRFLECVAKAAPTVRLRVDFNACLDAPTFRKFAEFMSVRVYRRLDLVEDPVPYDAEVWQSFREQWGMRLALDKGWKSGTHGFDAAVVKPTRRDWRVVAAHLPQTPLILTTAMDHGLGQAYAAYEAALAAQALGLQTDNPSAGPGLSLCGLVTHHLFERDAFFERFSVQQGRLQVDRSGPGLGFGDVLEKLDWQPLA